MRYVVGGAAACAGAAVHQGASTAASAASPTRAACPTTEPPLRAPTSPELSPLRHAVGEAPRPAPRFGTRRLVMHQDRGRALRALELPIDDERRDPLAVRGRVAVRVLLPL